MLGEEMLMSMANQGGGGGKKKGGFGTSGEFFSGLADTAIDKGIDLYKILADEKRKKHENQVAELQQNRALDLQAMGARNNMANANRNMGFNAMQFLAGIRGQAAQTARARDSLIYGV